MTQFSIGVNKVEEIQQNMFNKKYEHDIWYHVSIWYFYNLSLIFNLIAHSVLLRCWSILYTLSLREWTLLSCSSCGFIHYLHLEEFGGVFPHLNRGAVGLYGAFLFCHAKSNHANKRVLPFHLVSLLRLGKTQHMGILVPRNNKQ